VYRPPSEMSTAIVIDLGANIGLTSIYLSRRHGASTVIAVEPDPENCRIARENFASNNIPGIVIQAAVGPAPGIGLFQGHRDSNIGSLSSEGVEVSVITMPMLMERIPGGRADLVKMDIEGGEGPLLSAENGWLDYVDSILAEFHPSVVDCAALIEVMKAAGFLHTQPGANGGPSVESFTRATQT